MFPLTFAKTAANTTCLKQYQIAYISRLNKLSKGGQKSKFDDTSQIKPKTK